MGIDYHPLHSSTRSNKTHLAGAFFSKESLQVLSWRFSKMALLPIEAEHQGKMDFRGNSQVSHIDQMS
jgi:hypothetical protein